MSEGAGIAECDDDNEGAVSSEREKLVLKEVANVGGVSEERGESFSS